MTNGIVFLKRGREKPVHNRHPWVFSGAIDFDRSKLSDAIPGAVVDVRDASGGFLAQGFYNPRSQIRIRLLSWDQNDVIGPAWWRIQLARAIGNRSDLAHREDLNAYRLVHAENDGLPGLVVDRYDDVIVLQSLAMGVEAVKETVVDTLAKLLSPATIYERSDSEVRSKEGLADSTGLLWGETPPDLVPVHENNVEFLIDVRNGHKTGFYLDQRDSRAWLLRHPAVKGKHILNCFSYTGGFGLAAGINGAKHVTHLDTSQASLDLAVEHTRLNKVTCDVEYVQADVFEELRRYRDAERTFDVIILDPPKFAHSQKQVESAARGYKDINMLAFDLLEPGGLLMTFSCSGQVDTDLFQKIVFSASADSGVQAQIVHWFAQPEDHPMLLSYPEGRYLKGLVCRVMGY